MRAYKISIIALVILLLTSPLLYAKADLLVGYIRVNQLGYLSDDPKQAIAFSQQSLEGKNFLLVNAETGKRAKRAKAIGPNMGSYGKFDFHHVLDFSQIKKSGRYKIKIKGTNIESLPFTIGEDAYANGHKITLEYIRQQRCGFNPFFDKYCHQKDGKSAYGPMPDSTYIDVSGGWHDAGDHLRYLMTSGNTICRMLLAYRENPGVFVDEYDAMGHQGMNGIPDILDEAKWGLDWMLKMHPEPDQLFHQVADDRDHIGFKLPFQDTADYGWGPGSYRTVYYASGEPQGLWKYQNTSTGIANLAGRYAAAMAMAYETWTNVLEDSLYAKKCLQAGLEVYEMGLKQPGCQEGTPNRAPYRYHEVTWADDMEWGAAELFRATGAEKYMTDARKYARLAGPDPWMGADTARHYEFYPFMNMGHFALFDQVDQAFQDTLIEFYRTGIEAVATRASDFPYGFGTPFIWCSNNLAAAFVNQCLLYERMSGDKSYRQLMANHRDWLLGRNPWGVSQFVSIPESGGVTPLYPHTAATLVWDVPIKGGMNDGPVYGAIYASLKGIKLSGPDVYADFQSDWVVFHDDVWDYSTNEPTLDGTAEALFFLALLARD